MLAQAAGLDLKRVRLGAPELLTLYEAPLVLIRPDHIVAWRAQDESRAADVLKTCTGH